MVSIEVPRAVFAPFADESLRLATDTRNLLYAQAAFARYSAPFRLLRRPRNS